MYLRAEKQFFSCLLPADEGPLCNYDAEILWSVEHFNVVKSDALA